MLDKSTRGFLLNARTNRLPIAFSRSWTARLKSSASSIWATTCNLAASLASAFACRSALRSARIIAACWLACARSLLRSARAAARAIIRMLVLKLWCLWCLIYSAPKDPGTDEPRPAWPMTLWDTGFERTPTLFEAALPQRHLWSRIKFRNKPRRHFAAQTRSGNPRMPLHY